MRRPWSLAAWVLLGYFAVGLPLLLAVALGQLSLRELTRHSQILVQEGSRVTQLGSRLRGNINNLERAARQYVALGDEDLLALFYQRMAQVDATLNDMHEQGLGHQFGLDLVAMREQLAELVQQWNAGLQGGRSLAPAVAGVQALGQQAQQLIERGHGSIERETEAMSQAAERARQRMLACAWGLLPLAGLSVWLLMGRLQRATRGLRAAIDSLGEGVHEQPIAIRGPRELEALGSRLDWLRLRLIELEGDKDRFLRHVSHELKTPLSSLREAADLLADDSVGHLNDKQLELRQILLDASDELRERIEQLLAYAAWRREQSSQNAVWLSVDRCFADLAQRFELALAAKRLQLQCSVECERVFAQPQRLNEAARNLLSNAIKHAHPGQPVELTMRRHAGGFELSLRDHGDGVPDHEKLSIFEPFVRGQGAAEQGIPGTGVGLSIVSECALAHQGEVFVEDANPGSRFVFRWPDRS